MRAWTCGFWVGIVFVAGLLTSAVGADSNFMTISSPDFAQGSPMAKTFAYKGDNPFAAVADWWHSA